jgi:HK97 family phage major capsid protein
MSFRITNLSNVLAQAANTPWALMPEKLEAIVDVLAVRAQEPPLSADDLQARIGAAKRDRPGTEFRGNVAVIPLFGTIMPRANMMTEMSGATSVAQWIQDVRAAVANPDIGAVVLDVDSPGGAVSGVMEAADALNALRGQKPIVAVANGLMASAAYWLASQADSIAASPSSEVGSIGVYTVHRDLSRAMENEGVRHTVVRAGKYKAEALPFAPLTPEAHEAMQSKVDEAYDAFLGAVARGRGVSVDAVRAGYGEGRVLSAAKALAAGMIDRVATLDEVVRDIGATGRVGRASGRRADDEALPLVASDDDALSALMDSLDMVADSRAGATVADDSSRTSTALQAEETTVTIVATPAPTGAPVSQDDRVERLAELAELRPEAAHRLPVWIREGTTYQQARAEVSAGMDTPTATRVTGVHDRATEEPWETFGHFAFAVAKAGTPGIRASDVDVRLFAAGAGMNQQSPSDGGFAVPGQFNNTLWEGLFADTTSILSRTDNYDVDGEFIELLAVDDTTRATGTVFGGVTANWINEGAQIAPSKPKMRKLRLEPQELAALAYATEKLLNNSPVALGQFLNRAMRAAIALKVNEAVIDGDGVGKPKGLLRSGAKVTVPKKGSQANGTILAGNIADMKARRIASVANQYVWLYNTDIEPQLEELNTPVKNVAGTENVGGFASPQYNPNTNRLGGLDMIPNDHCPILGAEGDLMLVYLPAYAVGLRRAGVKTAESMHLRFDYAEMAFRAMFDIDGQSWLNAPLTPAKGSNKSTIITLQAR